MTASDAAAKLSLGVVGTFADSDLVQNNFIRTSRSVIGRLAAPLVQQMGISSKPVVFLDNACGAGALVQEVRKALTPDALKQSSFTCTDVSEQMVQAVKIRTASEGWDNVEAQVANAQVCPLLVLNSIDAHAVLGYGVAGGQVHTCRHRAGPAYYASAR